MIDNKIKVFTFPIKAWVEVKITYSEDGIEEVESDIKTDYDCLARFEEKARELHYRDIK